MMSINLLDEIDIIYKLVIFETLLWRLMMKCHVADVTNYPRTILLFNSISILIASLLQL